jgi:hypothetical protein
VRRRGATVHAARPRRRAPRPGVDKFDALNSYWSAYVFSRVLSYLGGFEQEGLA